MKDGGKVALEDAFIMKICCGLLGVGGPLLGWGYVRKNRRH